MHGSCMPHQQKRSLSVTDIICMGKPSSSAHDMAVVWPLFCVICAGFFPKDGCTTGERFLFHLAAATGGTFQVYNADLPVPAAAAAVVRNAKGDTQQLVKQLAAAEVPSEEAVGAPKAWDSGLGAFVAVNLENEEPATRAERHWAESKLKQRRWDNKR